MAREDVEDQDGAVQHARLQGIFDVARLRWRQFIVEHDEIIAQRVAECGDFFDLTGTNEITREGLLEALIRAANYIKTGGVSQQGEFLERVFGFPCTAATGQFHTDEKSAFTGRAGFVEAAPAIGSRLIVSDRHAPYR